MSATAIKTQVFVFCCPCEGTHTHCPLCRGDGRVKVRAADRRAAQARFDRLAQTASDRRAETRADPLDEAARSA